jgi:hypothetical protein
VSRQNEQTDNTSTPSSTFPLVCRLQETSLNPSVDSTPSSVFPLLLPPFTPRWIVCFCAKSESNRRNNHKMKKTTHSAEPPLYKPASQPQEIRQSERAHAGNRSSSAGKRSPPFVPAVVGRRGAREERNSPLGLQKAWDIPRFLYAEVPNDILY